MIYLLILFCCWLIWFLWSPPFGALPKGGDLSVLRQSPNFREGKFQNLHHTPDIVEGVSYYKMMKEFFFDKEKDNIPPVPLPSRKIDLFKLDPSEDCLVWFGHSGYFMQLSGKKILIDPVLSGAASPIWFTTRAFAGADAYTVKDIPAIDYLFISHDHWDHLDYKTISRIQPTVGKVFCGLGVGAHLRRWGYSAQQIVEGDWDQRLWEKDGFVIDALPARHFSGRQFKRNQALWVSFALQTPSLRLYIGGDSGYDDHFRTIGEKYGSFDWAILDCGQYHPYWKYIHMMPEEVVQAAQDLNAQKLLPVHWGKFSLSMHGWKDPINRVTAAAAAAGLSVAHPMIGDKLPLNTASPDTERWWDTV